MSITNEAPNRYDECGCGLCVGNQWVMLFDPELAYVLAYEWRGNSRFRSVARPDRNRTVVLMHTRNKSYVVQWVQGEDTANPDTPHSFVLYCDFHTELASRAFQEIIETGKWKE